MYVRRTQRKRSDGSVVGYLQLAHNRRVGSQTTAEVLVNLGREDQLDTVGLRRLAGSITRYLDGEGADPAVTGAEDGLRVVASKTYGALWLLDQLWASLGIASALGGVLDARRFTTDVERVLFALVANRAVAPSSKLAASEWASLDAAVPGLEGMDEDQAYRAMDLLVEADAQGAVQEAVFFAAADLLNLEVDLLFFDTTSTYFERDTADPSGEDGEAPFRAYGHSKDHRADLPQVVIGLAVTREGIPVRVWCWPGNTSDMSVIGEVKDDLRGWRLGRVITVVDRGFSSDANLAYLTRTGGHWIAGERMRDGSKDAQEALSRQGRYQAVRDNLRVKEVLIGAGDARKRFIVCHNPAEAERQKALRDTTIERLEAELARLRDERSRLAQAATKKTPAGQRAKQRLGEAHTRAECALRDHPTLGRYLRQTTSGRLLIDRSKIAAEKRLDGKYLLSTSDPTLSAEDVALGYKNLLEAERGFRDLKGILELRPVYHRLEQRIRAHVTLCWLALLLIRVIERQTAQTWRHLSRELNRLHQVTLEGTAGSVTQTTSLTDAQRAIYTACSVDPPPPITAISPA
jgi:transposase